MAPEGYRGRGQGRAGKREVKAWATRVLPRGEGTPAARSVQSPLCLCVELATALSGYVLKPLACFWSTWKYGTGVLRSSGMRLPFSDNWVEVGTVEERGECWGCSRGPQPESELSTPIPGQLRRKTLTAA